MRILLDECMPKRLVKALLPHDAVTVARMGWLGKKNGILLRLMEKAGFDALLTVDANLPYQQSFAHSRLSLIVLKAKSNDYIDLLPLIPMIHVQLRNVEPGKIYIIK